MKWKRPIILSIAFLIATLIPLPESVVPGWRLRVTYADGAPASGIAVYQLWKDSSTEPGYIMHQEREEADSNGIVTFSERRIFTPLLLRGLGSVLSHIDFWSHSSYGRFSEIYAVGYHPHLVYRGQGELSSSLILLPDEDVPTLHFNDLGQPTAER